MSPDQVYRLAQAIALANGHPTSDEWATTVQKNWEELLQKQADPEHREEQKE